MRQNTQVSLHQTARVPGDAASQRRQLLALRGSRGVDGENHFRGLTLSSVWITGKAYRPICHLQGEVDTSPLHAGGLALTHAVWLFIYSD